ncbi:mechanosensitive ion channel family protein [Tabrizicola piscis]|uniref:Mechanosensitive ion channel family protein n=1 Tax=Tabrizicola piscis TaxID=2494374 RepID=A0A3S8UA85_9RHOB|nr:mechanosensitive ion channel family protein [Tabrizicola piscis]
MTRLTGWPALRWPVLRWLTLALALLAAPAPAQDQTGAVPITGVETAPTDGSLNYAEWETMAERAEAELANRNTSTDRLDEIRSQLAKWRAALLDAQSANSARIITLRQQLDALGPTPAEGETEAEEISKRRQELAGQLVRLQAPGIAAEEAYRRANGLIAEIDRNLRDRQADELLQLWPSPLNPGNWPEAAIGLSDTLLRLWDEAATAWEDPEKRAELFDNMPLILVLLVVALALVVYVRRWIEVFCDRLLTGASARGRSLWSLLASTGGVILPTLGMVALAAALVASGMPGEIGMSITSALPAVGFVVFAAAWLGARAFPLTQSGDAVLPLPPERRAEGRFLAVLMGLVVAAEGLRSAAMDAQAYSDATTSVMSFPILLTGGLILLRVGRVLRRAREQADRSYALRLLLLLARGLSVIGIAGPVLAAFGYVQAASALIYPAILSLGLITLLFILQRMFGDVWALIIKSDDKGRDALVPVLAGFAITLAALPVFALIWGARAADITELWTRFSEGFQMGETRISPTNFMVFAVVFIIGYMLTRLFQGALRTSILPKTSMDQGGQTALVAGIGYVGIFLAALIAVRSAGLDLSGLAIVAGALSVGIGFGLQNIVSNFISGIILLIERPVSEGDWIEVGGVQGRVRSISVRSTRIETFDRNDVIVPNADLITGQVTNWTRFNLSGRLIVPVGVAFGSDTRKVEQILREIAEAQPLAVLNPPPTIVLMGFGADAINFEIRVILRDVNFSLTVRTEINHQIVERFAKEGIEIPFAQSDVSLRNVEEIARALVVLQAGAQSDSAAVHAPASPDVETAPKGKPRSAAKTAVPPEDVKGSER